MHKLFNRLPLIALAALPLTVGAVMAQSGTPPMPPAAVANQTAQRPAGRPDDRTDDRNVFVQKLAAQLGVSADRLKAAATAAANATIDQGVKAGDIPADRAQQMKTHLQQDPFALAGGHGGARGERYGPGEQRAPNEQRGPEGRADGPGLNRAQPDHAKIARIDAAIAKALGLSESQLRDQLRSGKSVAELAQAKGVSTAQLHAAAVAALNSALQAEVTAGRLTQAQATQRLQRAQANAGFGLLERHQK